MLLRFALGWWEKKGREVKDFRWKGRRERKNSVKKKKKKNQRNIPSTKRKSRKGEVRIGI